MAALSLGGWLAWEDLHRGPDETIDATGLPVVAPEVAKTEGRSLFRGTPIEVINAAVESHEREAQQHYLSGVVFFQKGDHQGARREWSESLRLDPGNAEAAAGLARIQKLYGGN